jgi:hypothetical protein
LAKSRFFERFDASYDHRQVPWFQLIAIHERIHAKRQLVRKAAVQVVLGADLAAREDTFDPSPAPLARHPRRYAADATARHTLRVLADASLLSQLNVHLAQATWEPAKRPTQGTQLSLPHPSEDRGRLEYVKGLT